MTQNDRRPLARPQEVADTVGLTPDHLKQMRYLGQGPKFIRVTGRQIRYRWEDVDAWLDSQTCSRADQRPRRETA